MLVGDSNFFRTHFLVEYLLFYSSRTLGYFIQQWSYVSKGLHFYGLHTVLTMMSVRIHISEGLVDIANTALRGNGRIHRRIASEEETGEVPLLHLKPIVVLCAILSVT